MQSLTGCLEVTAVRAVDLKDTRFLLSMSPSVQLEVADEQFTSPPCHRGGTRPQWDYKFPDVELVGGDSSQSVVLSVLDDHTVVGSVTLTLHDLISRAKLVNETIGSDHLVQLQLQVAQEGGEAKPHGDLFLSCQWKPTAANKAVAALAAAAGPPAPPRPAAKKPQLNQLLQQQREQEPGLMPQEQAEIAAFQQKQQQAQQQQQQQQHQQQPQQQMAMVMASPQPQPMMLVPASQSVIYTPVTQQTTYYAPSQQQVPVSYAQPQVTVSYVTQSQVPVSYAQQSVSAPMPQYVAAPAYSPQPAAVYYPQQVSRQVSTIPYYPDQQPISTVMIPTVSVAPPQPVWVPTPASHSDDGIFPYSELKITRLIGEGTFGTVSAGEFRSTPVAVKQLKQSTFTPAQWAEFESEVRFLREARHPNVVLYMGCTYNPYCIVTELLDTSLFDVLYKTKVALTHKQKVHIALGIARGLASLHSRPVPIVHRDVKSLNILLSNDLTAVKICDLGMVKLKAQYGTRLEQNGTPLWMAPEVLLNQAYDEQADVYSFGCVLYELTTSVVPFGGGNVPMAELAVRVGQNGERPNLPRTLEPHWRSLIIQCWQQHPLSRPNMKTIVATIAAIQV